MPQADNDGVLIEYDTFGDPADPAVLLVMGFTAQMTAWEEGFCRALVDRGHFAVRFDNRDCGLSSKTEGSPPNLISLLAQVQSGQGVTAEVPYTLSDMAGDAVAVLDHLEIGSANVVGASMGGMIVQMLAIEQPDRVASMTSIMSTTGNPQVGQAKPEAMTALLEKTLASEGFGAILDEMRLHHQIFGWIATKRHLGKNRNINALRGKLMRTAHDLFHVACEVTNDHVDLC